MGDAVRLREKMTKYSMVKQASIHSEHSVEGAPEEFPFLREVFTGID